MRRKMLKKGETLDEFHTQLYDRITRKETDILTRISKLKKDGFKMSVCYHFSITPDCE